LQRIAIIRFRPPTLAVAFLQNFWVQGLYDETVKKSIGSARRFWRRANLAS